MHYIQDNFGSKRGLVRYLRARLEQGFGKYKPQEAIDFKRVSRLVFVCKGNICRSPYASAFAEQLGRSATSFGIHASPGSPANDMACKVAYLRGLSLGGHSSQALAGQRWREGDLLIGMEPGHLPAIMQEIEGSLAQCTLLGLWAPSRSPYIHDPFACSWAYFNSCFSNIELCIKGLDRELSAVLSGSAILA